MANIKDFAKKAANPVIPPQLQKQMNIKVDINSLEDMNCILCGNAEYTPVVRIKKLPATVSPNGKEGSVNINLVKCAKCGWMFDPKAWEENRKGQEVAKKVKADMNKDDVTEMVKEKPGFSDEVSATVVKKADEPEDDNREMCRNCGEFYEKGTDHNCKP